MCQGWSRRNNPQAKMLTTVPRAAWHQGVVSHMVSLGNQAISWSIEALPLHAELSRGSPNTSLATCGIRMEFSNIKKSMYEEIFGGELDVTEKVPEPFESDKSRVKQYQDWLHERNERQLEILQKVESALEKMDKNMHLPMRDGIQEALKELGALRNDMENTVCYIDFFEYPMRGLMVQKIKEVRPPKSKEVADEGSQTLLQPTARSTLDTRKRVREPTVSLEASAAKKPAEKRPKVSNKEEEWVEVSSRIHLQKNKKKKPSRTPEKPRRARPEAMLIKPAEGMSYASMLRELKKRVNPDELDATVQGIKETRSKDLLVELKCFTKSRGRLDTAFKEAVGARGTVRHLIPRIEVEIADLEPTIEAEDVEDAVRSFFDQDRVGIL